MAQYFPIPQEVEDAISDQAQLVMLDRQSVRPLFRTGKLDGFAVSSPKRVTGFLCLH